MNDCPFGAFASDALLFLFGPASALFLPLVALVGLRMVRGVETGRLRRALLVAALGVALIGFPPQVRRILEATAARFRVRVLHWYSHVLVLLMV